MTIARWKGSAAGRNRTVRHGGVVYTVATAPGANIQAQTRAALAATRAGIADKLRAELDRTHPALVAQFQRAVPDMFDKAYRFVGEMEEIADFVGEDAPAQQMYEAIAEFYTRIAADHEGRKEETGALAAFLKKA